MIIAINITIIVLLIVFAAWLQYRRWNRKTEQLKRERYQRLRRARIERECEAYPGPHYWFMVTFNSSVRQMTRSLGRLSWSFEQFGKALSEGRYTV